MFFLNSFSEVGPNLCLFYTDLHAIRKEYFLKILDNIGSSPAKPKIGDDSLTYID